MQFTLVTDGPSDKALIPILVWCLRQAGVLADLQPQWADFRNLLRPPVGLLNKIRTALDLFPCDLLFVHRDAEAQGWELRNEEIRRTIQILTHSGMRTPHVCVVPVRMQEAWLLFNEEAIRRAAGNPSGSVRLNLPRLQNIEDIPNPKGLLFELLRVASELPLHRLRKMPVTRARLRITELIDDFSPLRALTAFRELEAQLMGVVQTRQWD